MKGLNAPVKVSAVAEDCKRKVAPTRERAAKKTRTPAQPKAKKDPNLPKKPPTAFFVFMAEFRPTYKESHPNAKGAAVVSKAGGDKWKSLSDKEKQVYVNKAAEMKSEYGKQMEAYEKNARESSVESKSEINDDEESTLVTSSLQEYKDENDI